MDTRTFGPFKLILKHAVELHTSRVLTLDLGMIFSRVSLLVQVLVVAVVFVHC